MRDWEANRDVLERIVALLFALAGLADLAANTPFLRRRRLLGILSHGEAEARAFVIDIVSGAPAPTDTPEEVNDATRLAVRLRMLALVLYTMLIQRFALHGAAGPRAGRPSHEIAGPAVCWPGASAPPASDTS